jgi:hypothetical protein
MARALVATVITGTLALAAAAASVASGAGAQQVGGVVQPQFGAVVYGDGSVSSSFSTVPVSVKRSVENGVVVVTIAPRE